MALRDPVAVFNADTNVEAQLVRTLLVDAGVEAFVVEDVSYVGTCALGTLPEINKPQVWVERADAERAWQLLDDYDRRRTEQETAETTDRFCYHCGEPVQPGDAACAACGQTLDPPTDEHEDGSDVGARAAAAVAGGGQADGRVASGGLAAFRWFVKPLAWVLLAGAAASVLVPILGGLVEFVARLVNGGR